MPTNLASTGKTSSTVSLSWTASTDNVGVTGYKIYRGGTQVGTSTTTSYTNTGLSASTQYSYTVSAYDAAGNNSAQCSAIQVTTNASGTNYLSNNSFENGSTGWTTYSTETMGTVTSPTPEDGTYAAQGSNRSSSNSWLGQDLLSTLNSLGQGNRTVSAWVRTPSGTKSFNVAIATQVNGTWVNQFNVTGTASSSGWTQITGVVNVTWSGTLTDAVFLVSQCTDTSNYYVDNCSVS